VNYWYNFIFNGNYNFNYICCPIVYYTYLV